MRNAALLTWAIRARRLLQLRRLAARVVLPACAQLAACALLECLLPLSAVAQVVSASQATVLRGDRSAAAEARGEIAAHDKLELLQLGGGWAQVRGIGAARQLEGWVRASTLDLDGAEAAPASRADNARPASGYWAEPVAGRALPAPPPREGRHALIVGIGQYRADPARPVAALAGVAHDLRNALAIARRMQVPADNITLLRDAGATRDAVQQALAALVARVQPGDRVFVYWSGHGSRYFDPAAGGCVETLVPHDLKDIGNRQFAQWLQPVAAKAEKLMVVYDACHSGGVGAASNLPGGALSRSLGAWVPKTATAAQPSCYQASNLRTRSFDAAARGLGLSGQDVVHLASSRPDEVSFDNAETGGLATYALSRCLAGEAHDADGSGAVTMEELTACAQTRINAALAAQSQLLPHHLVLSGNRGFVPAWFAASPGQPAPSVTAPAPLAAPATPPQGAPPAPPVHANPPTAAQPAPPAVVAPAPSPVVPPAPAVHTAPDPAADTAVEPASLRQMLAQIHDQRDSKRRVGVVPTRDTLRIGQDALDLAITSSHSGHVYIALAGSDQKSLYLLFPNAFDDDNRIAAGQTLLLPRQRWRVTAGGPPGHDTLLVMVADGARDLSALGGGSVGPFARPLTDAAGRTRLQWLLGQRAGAACRGLGCSDSFGSALLMLEER